MQGPVGAAGQVFVQLTQLLLPARFIVHFRGERERGDLEGGPRREWCFRCFALGVGG